MEVIIIIIAAIYAIVSFAHTVIWIMLMGFKWKTIWIPILMGVTWLFIDPILIYIGCRLNNEQDKLSDELDHEYSDLY